MIPKTIISYGYNKLHLKMLSPPPLIPQQCFLRYFFGCFRSGFQIIRALQLQGSFLHVGGSCIAVYFSGCAYWGVCSIIFVFLPSLFCGVIICSLILLQTPFVFCSPFFLQSAFLPYALRFAQGFFHIIEVRFAAAGSHNSHRNIPFGIVRLAEAFCPAINKPGPFIFVSKPQLQPVIFKQFYHPPYLFIRSLHFSAHPSQYFQPLIGLYGQAHLRGSLSRRRQTLPSQITLAGSAITACRPAPDDPYSSLSISAVLPLPAVFRPDALQAAAAAA